MIYVSSMLCNLLSDAQLVQKGYLLLMKNNALELFDRNKNLVLKSPLTKNKTFQTSMRAIDMKCLYATMSIQDN